MMFFKKDGSIDVERINNLPIDKYINVIENLTESQQQEYNSQLPINEGKQHTKAVFVDSTMEEEIKKGTCVDADVFLKKMRDTYLKNDKSPIY